MRKDRFFIWIPFGLSSDKPSDCFRFCSRFHCLLLPCRSEGTPLQNIELLDASQTCKKLASHMLEYELVYLMLKLTFLCSNPIGHFISHDLCSKRCGVWSSLKLCLKVVWSKNNFRCSTSKSWLGVFWNQPYIYICIDIYIYIWLSYCPYGICWPCVRGGWGLDALGKAFRRRRRCRRLVCFGNLSKQICFNNFLSNT